MRRVRDGRGSAALEMVLLVPVIMLLLGLLLAGGRIWLARAAVAEAAQSAARAASLARTATAAAGDGTTVGLAALSDEDLHCDTPSVTLDLSAFAAPPGTPATIRASVTCRVSLGDILLPGLPGSMIITATASAALDTFRARR